MSRFRNYTIAAVLAAAIALFNTITSLVLLPQGSDKINHSDNQPPYAVLMIGIVVGVIGLVAAWGVFRSQRWGVIVTLIVMVISILVSLPGIPFGPTTYDKVNSAVGVVLSAVVIYFLLRRDTRVAPKVELNA